MDPIYHRPQLATDLARRLLHPGVLDEGLRSGLFLSGLRRTGKTTFVRMDLIPALQNAGALVIYVDLWTDTSISPAILTRSAIRQALKALQSPTSLAPKYLKRVKSVGLGVAGLKFDFHIDSVGEEGGTTLADAFLAVVDQAQTNLVFIMDEVQQAITTEDGNSMLLAMKAARDAINQRPDTPGRFLFVGTGSHRAMVSELTARRNQAFAGAVAQPYPVLGPDYVAYERKRMQPALRKHTPSLAAIGAAFDRLGHRPEDLRKALHQLSTAAIIHNEVDATFDVIVDTLRRGAADLELRTLENLGTLATAIFSRIASSKGDSRGVFSTAAAAEYSKAVGRDVKVEEIQPVADRMLDANLIMRKRHGVYAVTDPFVQQLWLEQHAE
ncbi:MAG: hypothetical protein ACRD27_11490 [Terracidiphilus sp.]